MSNEHSPNQVPIGSAPSTDETPAGPRYETGAHLLMCPLTCPPRSNDNFINVVAEYRSEIDKYLDSVTPFQDEFRAVVLYSSGVTGKTTLAVHYAVTSFDLIKHYWPDETCDGRAIITTKSDALALGSFGKLPSLKPEAFIRVKAINIQQKSINETIRDLLKIEAHLPIGSTLDYSNIEREDIYRLCSRLKGNMQEMIIMGALLGRKIYITEAMSDYFKRLAYQPSDHQSPVWPLVFKSLNSNSQSLLSITAFLYGEMGIHLDLFRARPLPEDMACCKNDAELRISLKELSDLSLISWMEELDLIGISHTTQTNFLKWLGEEGVSVSLERATKLLHGIFHEQIRANVEKQGMRDYDVFFFCLPHGSSYLMALSYIATGNYSKALEWFWRESDAWRANTSVPPGTSRDSRPLPPMLMAQEGWACLLLNDLDSAKPLLESALEYIKPEHQYDSEATGTIEFVNFHLAKLRIHEKNFADAKEKLLTAQCCIREYPLQEFSQFHASYLYYLALCEMELGNLQQARTYIDSTARITRIYQDEMPMEHARCLHMRSRADSHYRTNP
ncbi:hypothetical protein N7481_005664 [Penicillium waksmanii]|uniref:uncharacterized protein n=1 Tax=Penicillium waksmanii TaxID=69791 RepID=UPI0025477211|nr:uncharacterized protein N7481_005664 [Penicillium waksmanii]KAJ5983565.1 hypothetical protein N7481_005664 [Penicillium waksmanii]